MRNGLCAGPFSLSKKNPLIVWRCSPISSMEHQINEEIRDKEVRLISNDGEQLGIVAIQKAQEIAVEKGMDLVKIAPQAKPPVCKIMDYGKFRFEQAKREKEARKNQRVVEIKEIRLTPNIDIGDLNTKVKNACRFLKDGDKVKVSVRFRGREVTHSSLGQDLLHRFAELCSECSTVEKQPKLEGRQMLMFLAPAKDK
ncbi:translation initiation factor IF-3 [Butyricicoccus sp. OM04-18BH]|nr:translation initiation factor IF-3 [Butyricicoccus sp. AM29-23AC]RHV41000.1 translation initiation factor IF-3 [Butyricicoccus sp. OM04-18BH]